MARQLERWGPARRDLVCRSDVGLRVFATDVPDADAAASDITAYLADCDNHVRNIIGAYMWVVGALAFLWFLAYEPSDGEPKGTRAPSRAWPSGAGVVFAALWVASAAALATVPMRWSWRRDDASYGDLAQLDEVRRLADQIHANGPVDALVHNAGVWVRGNTPRMTADGLETTFRRERSGPSSSD
jgi:hypothetical protein